MTTLSLKNDAVTEVAQLLIDQVGTDEVATSKLTIGAAGVNDGFVSSSNPLPVTGTITAVTSITNAVAVTDNSGSLTVDNAALAVTGGGVEASALRVTIASDSTGVVSVDDNGASLTVDNAALAVTGGGVEASALRVTIASDSTGLVSVDDNGGSLTVDNGGTFAVQAAQSGTWNVTNVSGTVSLPTGASTAAKQPALGTAGTASADVISVQGIASMTPLQVGDNSGSLTVDAPVGTPVFVRLSDGSAAISTLPVSLASVPSHAVTNAGTFAVQAASAGDFAHDSADSGNPVKVGAKAESALSGITLVADGDRTDLYAGVDGVLITRPHCNLEDIVSGNASNTDGTSTQCIAAQAAGVKTYLTSIILTNTSSSNTYVEIKDGTTVKLTIPVPANGGAVCNLPVPLGGTAATAWNFDPGAATTTMYCSMVGFKSKV